MIKNLKKILLKKLPDKIPPDWREFFSENKLKSKLEKLKNKTLIFKKERRIRKMIKKSKNKIKLFKQNSLLKFFKGVVYSFLLLIIILGQLISPQVANAATFTFNQTSWSGGATANVATHINNQTGWNEFLSKNGVDTSTTVSLTPVTSSVTHTSNADFNTGTNYQTAVSGADASASIKISKVNFTTPKISMSAQATAGDILILKSDGTVWSSGLNNYGQLGDNSTINRLIPVQVHGPNDIGFLTGIVDIATEVSASFALKSDGTVWAWGINSSGQLADGTTTQRKTPVQVHGPNDVGFLTGIVDIAANYNNVYAVKSDGTVWAWGYNSTYQIGDGTNTMRSFPVQVHGPNDVGFLTDIISVSASPSSAFALKSDGTVWAWGNNGNSILGDGTATQRTTPVQVHGPNDVGFLTEITAISSGNSNGYALKSDGTVWSWGSGIYGVIGDNATSTRSTPVQVHGPNNVGFLTDITNISSGNNHIFALKSDGTVWAWGRNGNGQLGINSTTQSNVPIQVHGLNDSGFLTNVIVVAGGNTLGFAIQSDGATYSWGDNTYGQLGDDTIIEKHFPISVILKEVVDLNLGTTGNRQVLGNYLSAYALKSDGTVFSWGANTFGQLGNNSTIIGYYASLIPNLTGITKISAAYQSAYALKSDGTVWSWGDNTYGQLGDNSVTQRNAPVQVHGPDDVGFLTNIIDIAANSGSTYALKSDGTVWSWGRNNSGQLGNNTIVDSYVPVQVHGPSDVGFLTGVASISATGNSIGQNSAYVLKSDGTVWSWGGGGYGQLGDGTTLQRNTPVQVRGVGGSGFLTGVSDLSDSIASGTPYAIKSDGTAYAWGVGNGGQRGDNSLTQNATTPVQIKGVGGSGFLTGVTKIAAGNTSGYVTKSDGTVFSFGMNNYGQLGDNSVTQRNAPVQVHGLNDSGFLTDFVSVGGGTDFASAIKSDGTVWSWGINGWYQLANGLYSNSYTPVKSLRYLPSVSFNAGTDTYYSSGNFTSGVLDLNSIVSFSTITYDTTLNSQTVAVDVRAGDSATVDDTWTSWQTGVASGGNISSLGAHRYFQYRINLATSSNLISPTFNSITINYNSYTSGDITSSVYNSIDATNLISKLSWTESNTSGTEIIKFQVRSSPDGNTWSSWCGYADCSGSTYFNSADNDVSFATNHPLRNGGNDQYVQYKGYLSSAGAITPIISGAALTYVVNVAPTFNIDFPTVGAGGATASQNTNPLDSDFAQVNISYSVKDVDTVTGTANPNQILPSFEYSIDGGNNWTPIPSDDLANGDASLQNILTSFSTLSATWDARTTIPNVSVSNAQIRVTVNDNEAANSSVSATTSDFSLDTKAPVGNITFDAGIAGQNNSATISIPMPTDISAVEYKISDDVLTETNPVDTGWVSIANSTTIPWSFDSDIEVKILKYQFRDSLGNTTTETTVSTQTPVPSGSFIVQDTSNISAEPPYYDMYIGWQAASATGFSSYKLEYATSDDNTNYTGYGTISDSSFSTASSNYYVYRNLNPDKFYRFRLGVVGTNGNTSVRSNSFITAKPDGVQNYGEGGGGSIAAASKVENVVPEQALNKNVTVTYKLTDASVLKKVTPLYEGYIFYNIGITLPANSFTSNTLTLSDASKLNSSGYILVNNEVIGYSGKTGNILTGLVRGTWPNLYSAGRATRTNPSFLEGTPVWVNAKDTTPINISDISIETGQNGSIVWDTSNETNLLGDTYSDVGIKVIVHDNQDALSGPLSSQNDFSENGILDVLDLSDAGTGSENILSTSAVISWVTTDYADSVVEYSTIAPGAEGEYGLIKSDSDMVLNHRIYLNNLIPSTLYYFRTKSTNLNGETIVSVSEFTTTAGPILSAVSSGNITDVSSTVSWTTDIPATSYVVYSLNSDLSSFVKVGSNELVMSHSVVINNLVPLSNYYYKVESADASVDGNVGEESNNETYYTFETLSDATPPVISNIDTPIISPTSLAIVWKTNEPADGQILYGIETGSYTEETTLNENLVLTHLATVFGLTKDTSYYYVIKSVDENGNETTSEEQTVTTPIADQIVSGGGSTGVLQSIYDALLAENEANKAKLKNQTSEIPIISDIKVSNVAAFGATISFSTNADTMAFIKYSKDKNYSLVIADDVFAKNHAIKLTGLNMGTDYYFKVKVIDRYSNEATSLEQAFKTKFFSENLSELTKIENIEQFQAEIESTIESILPSLVPPFIDTPVISNITENSATISFKTNIKAYPIVSYATDAYYDITKDNPYDGEISDTTGKNVSHVLQIIGLKPNTKYHVMAKAFSLPQVVGKGEDLTFSTKASRIKASVVERKNDSFTIVWTTDEPTSSIVEYKNIKSGKAGRMTDEAKNTSHSVKVENLVPGSSYVVNVSGINSIGNLVEGAEPITVNTSTDVVPPTITNFKVDSALVLGRTDKTQTIVSWQTDEPATSIVYYEEGSGSPDKELVNKKEDLELTMNHVAILTTLKPGTVYRFQIASVDDANNINKLPIRTIITPRPNESIVDIIFKNFDETFNFIKNVK